MDPGKLQTKTKKKLKPVDARVPGKLPNKFIRSSGGRHASRLDI
jgi:hypothetical protein